MATVTGCSLASGSSSAVTTIIGTHFAFSRSLHSPSLLADTLAIATRGPSPAPPPGCVKWSSPDEESSTLLAAAAVAVVPALVGAGVVLYPPSRRVSARNTTVAWPPRTDIAVVEELEWQTS